MIQLSSLFTRFQSFLKPIQTSIKSSLRTGGFFGFNQTSAFLSSLSSVYTLNEFEKYLRLPAVCPALSISLNFILSEAARVEFSLADKNGEQIGSDTDWRLGLFNNESLAEFRSIVLQHLILTGNCFIVAGAQNSFGKTIGYTCLLPCFVKVNTNELGIVTGYTYDDRKNKRNYLADEVIHIKLDVDILNPLYGKGYIAAEGLFNRWISNAETLEKFSLKAGIPSLIFESTSETLMDDKELKTWEEKMTSKFSGSNNAGNVGIAPSGFKTVPIVTPSQVLANLSQLERDAAIEIFKLFGIPQYRYLGTVPTYDNLKAENELFKTTTLNALINKFVTVCNKLIGLQGMAGKTSFVVVETNETTLESYRADVQSGLVTPNEARTWSGLEPNDDPNADKLLVPSNLTPIDMLGQNSPVGIAASKGSILAEKKTKPYVMKERVKSWRDSKLKSSPEGVVWKLAAAKRSIKIIQRDMKRLLDATHTHNQKKLSKKVENLLGKQVKSILSKFAENSSEYNQLLEKYGPKQEMKSSRHELKGNGNFNEELKALVKKCFSVDESNIEVSQLMSDSAKELTADVCENNETVLTISIDPEKAKAVAEKVSLNAGKKTVRMSESTRTKLERYIKNGIAEGKTVNECTNGIYKGFSGSLKQYCNPETGEVYRSTDTSQAIYRRAETISATEVTKAMDLAHREFYKQTPVAKTFQIIGCTEVESGYDCNRTNIQPDEIDSIERHPRCTGTLVIESFNESFGGE